MGIEILYLQQNIECINLKAHYVGVKFSLLSIPIIGTGTI